MTSTAPQTTDLAEKAKQARLAFQAGRYSSAIKAQLAVVNQLVKEGESSLNAKKRLTLYMFQAGEFESALVVLKAIASENPMDSEVLENIGVISRKIGRVEEAVKPLLEAYELAPERANISDALAHCFGALGDETRTREFGIRSLELKDAAAVKARAWKLPKNPPAPFAFDEPQANIIAFSLWGQNSRYLRGAVRNATLAKDLYPGWTCRFYCDKSVPKNVVEHLEKRGAQIHHRAKPRRFYEGLFWRFEVMADRRVKRFLIRDCDSVINIRERVAVDEWLAGDRYFHAMRDYHSHTEVLLAGLWGGVGGILPPNQLLWENFKPKTEATNTFDQVFLREMVWPTVRQSVLIHDSVFTGCLGSKPFPAVGILPPGRHVGQNEAVLNSKAA